VKSTARADMGISGTLIIRNSLVLWEQTAHQQAQLVVRNGGTLRIEHSYVFSRNAYWVNWDYESGATVVLDHYQGNPWSSVHGQVSYTATNGSTVNLTLINDISAGAISVSDASSVWLELFLPSGTHELSVPAPLAWGDEQFTGLWGASVHTTNSWVLQTDVTLTNGVHATVKDSPAGLGIGWTVSNSTSQYVDCELHDLGAPGVDAGVLYADKTWDLPCVDASLTFHNSRLLSAWPNTLGAVHLKVYTSNLADVRNYGSGGSPKPTFEVYNSAVQLLSATAGGLLYVENSTIKDDVQVDGTGSKVYTFGLQKLGGGTITSTQSNGGQWIVQSTAGPPW
jgi:hypothetical protein